MPYKDANGFYDKYDWNDFTTFVKEPSLSVQTGSESNELSIVAKDFDEFISSGYEVRVFVNNEITENVVDFTKGPSTACTISVDKAVTDAQVYIAPVSPDGKILNGIYGPIKSNIVSMNLVPGESESSEYSMSATNVAYNGTKVTFDLLLQSAEEMKGKAYVAVYENGGNYQLVYLNSYTATSEGIDVSIDYSAGQTLKIFWWDSDLTSLCDGVEVQVPSIAG